MILLDIFHGVIRSEKGGFTQIPFFSKRNWWGTPGHPPFLAIGWCSDLFGFLYSQPNPNDINLVVSQYAPRTMVGDIPNSLIVYINIPHDL